MVKLDHTKETESAKKFKRIKESLDRHQEKQAAGNRNIVIGIDEAGRGH